MKPSEYHACATGDCPHDDDGECIKALASHADELYETTERFAQCGATLTEDNRVLKQRIERQREILDKLPKCWQLTGGKLVQDCPVVPGMTVYRQPRDRVLAYVVYAVLDDTITATFGQTGCVLEPDNCANSPQAATALRQRSDDA